MEDILFAGMHFFELLFLPLNRYIRYPRVYGYPEGDYDGIVDALEHGAISAAAPQTEPG